MWIYCGGFTRSKKIPMMRRITLSIPKNNENVPSASVLVAVK